MKTKHTKGPWFLFDDGNREDSSDIITVPGEDGSEDVAIIPTDLPLKQRKANARLIAAAPDLLKALELLMDCRTCTTKNKWDKAGRLAKVAIEKAGGVYNGPTFSGHDQ